MAQPPRYFAGRPPAAPADSSSEDDAPPPPAAPPKRPRFVARVVSQPHPPSHPPPHARHAPRAGSFVPIGPRAAHKEEEEEEEEEEEDSSSGSDESSSEQESSGGEYQEEEEEEEEEEGRAVVHPVFIPRHLRGRPPPSETEVVSVNEERAAREKAARRREAQGLVAKILAEEENARDEWAKVGEEQLPDDEDRQEDREVEEALWKVREVLRVKRDREERAEWERKRSGEVVEPRKEKGDVRAVPKEGRTGKEARSKPAFLQKHYKLGPFFMETNEDGTYKEEIYNRDYNEGTEEDRVQRLALPAPMQVRRGEFGRAGRSKYTHLAAEDTAAGLVREMKQDRDLAEALKRNAHGRKT